MSEPIPFILVIAANRALTHWSVKRCIAFGAGPLVSILFLLLERMNAAISITLMSVVQNASHDRVKAWRD